MTTISRECAEDLLRGMFTNDRRAAIRAELEAALAAPEDVWRTKETAPRDGAEFQAAYRFPGEKKWQRTLMRYKPYPQPQFPWREEDGGGCSDEVIFYWLPLPPLPPPPQEGTR